MLRNKWLVLCLLIGSILAVAMVSTVPMYSDAVFIKMLNKDLEGYQEKSGQYPGKMHYRVDLATAFKEADRVAAYNKIFSKEIPKKADAFGIPWLTVMHKLDTLGGNMIPTTHPDKYEKRRYIKIEGIRDISDHIEFVDGRMSSDHIEENVIEVIISVNAMEKTDLLLNEIYEYKETRLQNSYKSSGVDMPRFKVVGVFRMKDDKDPFWLKGFENFNSSMIVDFDLFQSYYLDGKLKLLSSAEWIYSIDYRRIRLNDIPGIMKTFDEQQQWIYNNYRMSTTLNMPVVKGVLADYGDRVKTLNTTLLILLVPVLIMLTFYIFMVSQLIIEHEKNEIAVLKSRGASKIQIFMLYLIESAFLGGIGLILGPPLGLFLCKIIGSANGFLEFVQRTALPASLSSLVYLYSLGAVALFMVSMLIPAYLSSRTSIVEYKRNKARAGSKSSPWKRLMLDGVFLVLSGYGYYKYKFQKSMLGMPGVDASDLGVDPMLFLVCTFFILGVGLLFLRVYPYIVRFIFWLGRKIWPPSLYASFIQVGRSGGKEQFIMLFLIFTLSIGIFNANTARTVNGNLEDKIAYMNGPDIVASGQWMALNENGTPVEIGGNPLAGTATYVSNQAKALYRYYEPPFTPYTTVAGIELLTRVMRNSMIEARMGSGAWKSNVYVMGIEPETFGQMIRYREDVSVNWKESLARLAETPNGVLVSRTFLNDQTQLKEGDKVYYKLPGQTDAIDGIIVGILDYWPTFNPNNVKLETRTVAGKQTTVTTPPYLIVSNLEYIYEKVNVQPYEIWMKRDGITDTKTIYDDVVAKKVYAIQWDDTKPMFIKNRNDPLLKGTNGTLTLGFLVTLIISLIGFIIYWVLSIQARMLQFGILRAMGLNMKRLFGMLISEQILISGVALLTGILAGSATSSLFVPLLQVIYSSAEQILPFLVMTSRIDTIRVYVFAGVVLTAGLGMLSWIVSRINVGQALKLGED